MSETNIPIHSTEQSAGLTLPFPPESYVPDQAAPFLVEAASSTSILRKIFSFPAMLGVLLVGAVFISTRGFAVDPDLWWHIKNGQNILSTHHWPTTDSFSFTVSGQPWISTEWFGDVVLAWLERLGGLRGLEALLIVLGCAVGLALYAFATLRTNKSKAGLATAGVLLVLANASFSLRPQMLGYLFLVLTLIVLERFRQGKRGTLWMLPLLFLIWVNTHGSFVIGMGAIAVYLLSGLFEFRLGSIEARRWSVADRIRLEAAFLLCLVALTITPYGPELAVYPFHVASSLPIGVANVLEWQPMPFALPGGKIFLGLVLAFFAAQMAFRFAYRLEELVLLLGGTVMACLHARFLLVFVPFFAPLLAVSLAPWVRRYEVSKDRPILNAALMALAILGMLWYFPSHEEMEQTVARRFPVRAVEYMRQHSVPGPLFNNYDFGGYLVGADVRVFVDGRADPYERGGALADYFHVSKLEPGALQILNSYGIESCLLEPNEPLVTLLTASPAWKRVYADNLGVVFVKQTNGAYPTSVTGQPSDGQRE